MKTVDCDSGREMRPALIDPETGRAVAGIRMERRPGPGADDSVRAPLNRLNKGAVA